MDEFTYAKAGVDIEKENRVIKKLKGIIGSDDRILYEGMQIVMSTDGVGSKIIVANEMKKWDTIGIENNRCKAISNIRGICGILSFICNDAHHHKASPGKDEYPCVSKINI